MRKNTFNQAAYTKQKRDENRQWAVDLLGGECVRCGSVEQLEFDHIDPSTMEFRIGAYIGASREKILPELMKCQLLCHDCHLAKTLAEAESRKLPIQHGSVSTYNNKKCRCDLCKKAWREYYSSKQYRKKLVVAV